MVRTPWSRLAALLREAPAVLIAAHEQPDADALGSALALAAGLEQLGGRVQVACADPVPPRYAFLPGAQRVTQHPSPTPLLVILDAGAWSRLGSVEPVGRECAEVMVVDHHPGGNRWRWAHLDPHAAATALLVRRLLRALGATLTPEIATCLYAALGGDTGYFTFQNTDAAALRLAAELAAAGANPYEIHRQAADRLPLSSLHLRGRALASTRVAAQGRIAWAVLRREDFRQTGATDADTEGVVDLLKSAAGAEVYVLFKQGPEDTWRVSLRSRAADVGQVAQHLGGGGHRVAAGCTLIGIETSVRRRVLDALRRLLEEPRT